jgi:hypothetical protein
MAELYRTHSVCPECLLDLPAVVFEEAGSVFLTKTCPEHGDYKVKVDTDARAYRERMRLYFSTPLKYGENENFHLYLTDRCNLACPMCFTRRSKAAQEPTLDDIKRFLATQKNLKKVALLGGEPTVRQDLFEIIDAVRQAGGDPVICSNGIKLADYDYAVRLRDAGISEVHLQFDAFDDEHYRQLRGRDLAELKHQALKNMEALDYKVALLMTIEAGVNDHLIGPMLDFAIARPFIKGLVIRAAGASGTPGGKDDVNVYPEQLLAMIEEQTAGRISVKDIEDFQAIIISLVRLLRTYAPSCFKDRFYLLMRDGTSYRSVGSMFDLARFRGLLDKKARSAGSVLSVLKNPLSLLGDVGAAQFMVLMRFFLEQISPRRKSGFSDKGDLFVFGIAGLCDRYNFDRRVVDTCTSSLFINNRVYERLPDGFIVSNLD